MTTIQLVDYCISCSAPKAFTAPIKQLVEILSACSTETQPWPCHRNMVLWYIFLVPLISNFCTIDILSIPSMQMELTTVICSCLLSPLLLYHYHQMRAEIHCPLLQNHCCVQLTFLLALPTLLTHRCRWLSCSAIGLKSKLDQILLLQLRHLWWMLPKACVSWITVRIAA